MTALSDFMRRLAAYRPASKQSVAWLAQEVRQGNDLIMRRLEAMEEARNRQFEHSWIIGMDSRHDAARQHERLQQTIDSMDIRTMAYLRQLYFSGQPDRHEAAVELFASIPAADGPHRVFQLALAKLMHVLDGICRKNGIRYWLCWGALLAGRTRGSSIPWDDDIDICMLREDLDRLRGALTDSERYQVSVVYDRYVLCRQYRFSLRDAANPCFIDLCVFDWAPSTDPAHDRDLKTARYRLMDDLNRHMDEFPLWNRYPYLFAKGDDDVAQASDPKFAEQDLDANMEEIERIDAIFDRHREEALQRRLLTNRPDSPAVAYGLENIMDVPSRTMLFSTDRVFPTAPLPFEGYTLQAPHDCDYVLDQCHPGWPHLPSNMFGHRHFEERILDDPDVFETLRAFVETPAE